jgi:hypothetical protein
MQLAATDPSWYCFLVFMSQQGLVNQVGGFQSINFTRLFLLSIRFMAVFLLTGDQRGFWMRKP